MITSTATPLAIAVEPGSLLVTAPATTPLETLNEALLPYGLCLPIAALTPGLTLANLIARNAGGRRRLRYGTIVRYLRAATLQEINNWRVETNRIEDPSLVSQFQSLVVGGPTLKRATGYGLNRALVAGGLALGLALRDVTLNLRPLPPARRALRIAYGDLADACRIAQTLLAEGLSLSALAMRDGEPSEGAWLLVELEGAEAVIERQAARVQQLVANASLESPDMDWWSDYAQFAAVCQAEQRATLDLSLPRAALPDFIVQARAIAARYKLKLPIWGDAGVGALHLSFGALFNNGNEGEVKQAAALIYHLARPMGGALCTELGGGPLMDMLWQHEQESRGISQSLIGASSAPLQSPSSNPQAPIFKLQSLSSSPQSLFSNLKTVVGDRYLLTKPEDLACYTQDASIAEAAGVPLAVALPATTAEVSAVLRMAAQARTPVVTRGAGSGLAGGSTPSAGALVLSLNRMERFCLDTAQMTARVEAGVVTADLQRAAEAMGLLYPPDPSSLGVSTIGGNIACNAGGPRCLKYGVTADYVLGLTAVLADGTIIRVGDGLVGQTPDAGLLQLLIGSEGTLAVITEATLRLIPQPAARRTTMAIFDRLDDACTTVESIMAAGVIPAGLEIMDDSTIAVVEDYLQIGLPRDTEALLLLLADGEPEAVAQETEQLAALARRGRARSVQVARTAADEAALWKGRRSIAPALARLRPNRLGEDICVPLTQIAECVRRIKAIAAQYDQPIAVFGHAGDGNLHPNILFDSRDPIQVARVWQAAEAVFQVALDLGGTLSGEHGIGTLKRPFMEAALGKEGLALQRAIKARFDPDGRLNPGKVLP